MSIKSEGTWGPKDPRRAFVEGAAWWEFRATGATMWQSDRSIAEEEADRRYASNQDIEDVPAEKLKYCGSCKL